MSRQALPVSHYEYKLIEKFGVDYTIVPTELWIGVRTNVEISCPKHLTKRPCWLQKIFNGKRSLWPCRQCYLDSLKPSPTIASELVSDIPNSFRGTLIR